MDTLSFDTGKCVPESSETLAIQQRQLVEGKRKVQMFPFGTEELNLPEGFNRHQNFRGVFHYDAKALSPADIDFAGLRGSENEFLNLGPFSKSEIMQRVKKGEELTCIIEITLSGVEIRTALGTNKTIPQQRTYFEATKEPNSIVLAGVIPDRVRAQLEKVK